MQGDEILIQLVWLERGREFVASLDHAVLLSGTPSSFSRRHSIHVTAIALDSSPLNVLRSMRGAIVDARIAYPEVLHVEIKDSAGELWRLATQDADWSPSDPAQLIGRSVDDADIDGETGELRCKLSDGSLLDVKPAEREAEDDPPYWELITPGGVVLEFGPGVRWQIGRADDLASSRP